jgi:hypothetical protein
MKIFSLRILSVLALGFGVFALPTIAADATQGTAAKTGTQTAVAESGFNVLLGNWVRPDGGYTITITDVDPNGILDASYANPNPLPFAQAKASVNGEAIEVFLELRAGGYNGSTYNLTYDPENNVLRGIYYQAVAQQKFDIYFEHVE